MVINYFYDVRGCRILPSGRACWRQTITVVNENALSTKVFITVALFTVLHVSDYPPPRKKLFAFGNASNRHPSEGCFPRRDIFAKPNDFFFQLCFVGSLDTPHTVLGLNNDEIIITIPEEQRVLLWSRTRSLYSQSGHSHIRIYNFMTRAMNYPFELEHFYKLFVAHSDLFFCHGHR